MVLLNHENKPVHYNNTGEIIEAFYQERLPMYQKRKERTILEMEKSLQEMEHKARYIHLIVHGDIVLKQKSKSDMQKELDHYKLPHSLLSSVRIWHCTLEEYKKVIDNYQKQLEKLELYHGKTPHVLWKEDLLELREKLFS